MPHSGRVDEEASSENEIEDIQYTVPLSNALLKYIDRLFPWYMLITVIFLSSSLSTTITLMYSMELFFYEYFMFPIIIIFMVFYLTAFQIMSLSRIQSRRFKLYKLMAPAKFTEQELSESRIHQIGGLASKLETNIRLHNRYVWISWLGLISIFAVIFIISRI